MYLRVLVVMFLIALPLISLASPAVKPAFTPQMAVVQQQNQTVRPAFVMPVYRTAPVVPAIVRAAITPEPMITPTQRVQTVCPAFTAKKR
jgi:hypothetical protein